MKLMNMTANITGAILKLSGIEKICKSYIKTSLLGVALEQENCYNNSKSKDDNSGEFAQ